MRNNIAFTLVELLITLAVLAILCSIAFPLYTGYVTKSRQQDALVQLTAIRQAEEMYKLQYSTYTNNLTNANFSWRAPVAPPHKYNYSVLAGWSATTFTAQANGDIDQDGYSDAWTIDQDGTLTNTNNDVSNTP
jgi:type IV pilus assembly protein PilE